MKMWCIFNLFIDDVFVCNRPAGEFHCKEVFLICYYKISSVTFGFAIVNGYRSVQATTKIVAVFRISFICLFCEHFYQILYVCVCDLLILNSIGARHLIFSGKIYCSFFALSRKFSIFGCFFPLHFSIFYSLVHVFYSPAILLCSVSVFTYCLECDHEWIYFMTLTANLKHPTVLEHIVWINYK